MEIEVTQDCINEGNREDPEYCPVALAITKAKKDPYNTVVVGTQSIEIFGSHSTSEWKTIKTPDPVRRRITYYDRTGIMKPFKFELAI